MACLTGMDTVVLNEDNLWNVGVKYNPYVPMSRSDACLAKPELSEAELLAMMQPEMEMEMEQTTIEPLGIILITLVFAIITGAIVYCCMKRSRDSKKDNPEVELKEQESSANVMQPGIANESGMITAAFEGTDESKEVRGKLYNVCGTSEELFETEIEWPPIRGQRCEIENCTNQAYK